MLDGTVSMARVFLLLLVIDHAVHVGSVQLGNQFGHHSSYIKSFPEDDEAALNDTMAYELPGCSLTQIQMLVRHGTRGPTDRSAERIINLRNTLKNLGAKNAEQYTIPFTEMEQLTDVGREELNQMGIRFYRRYSAVFDSFKSNPQTASIFTTLKQRTKDSATAFLSGIDPDLPVQGWNVQEDNVALKFYDTCPARDQLKSRSDFKKEYNSFLQSDAFQAVKSTVLSNMELNATSTLTSDNIMDIYFFCGLLLANSKEATASPWCTVFDGVDLSVIEYALDLAAYYDYSYGHVINAKMACPFIKNMLANLRQAKDHEPGAQQVVLSFGHVETVLPVLSSMAMFRDSVPLTADNYEVLKESRKFKTSRIAPFAANVAVLLWDCHHGGALVQVMINERLNSETLCALNASCQYANFMNYFNDFIDCDFENICKASSTS